MSTAMPTSGASSAAGNKILWGAIGVLGVSTLALGAAVLHLRSTPPAQDPPLEVVATTTPAPVTAQVAAPASAAVPSPVGATPAVAAVAPAVPPHHKTAVHHAAPKTAVSTKPAPEQLAQTPVPAPVPPEPAPAKDICHTCGVVEAVTPVQRESANPSGVGAIAGAVLGGLVGNQFGGGTGKTLATVAGMVGGGIAGNTVEKKMKKDVVYQVDVRMDDGSVRHLEQSTPVGVGERVSVDGHTLHALGS